MAFDPKSAVGSNLRWRGAYDASKEYYRDDEVSFSGLTWRVRVEHVSGVAPPSLSDTYSPAYEFVSRQSGGGGGDLTGAEIVDLIDTELGGTVWRDPALAEVDLSATADADTVTITPSAGDAAVIPTATTDDAGVMSAAMFDKLAGIEDGAEVNIGTDLSIGTRTNTVVPLNSSTGTDVNLPQATTTLAGVMSGTDKAKLDGIEALADVTDAANVAAAGAVMEGDYDAQSILAAVSADTPIVVTFAASTFFGRQATGDVGAMSAAQARAVLNVEDGAQANVGTDLAIGTHDDVSIEVESSTGNDVVLPAATDTLAGLMSAADKVILDGLAGGGGGGANLSLGTVDADSVQILSDSGTDVELPAATATDAGVATAAQITKLDGIEAGADVTDAANVNAAGAVMESDYNAQTILAATADNTPAPLTVGEDTLVGRLSGGNIAAISPADVRTLLNVEDGAEANVATDLSIANRGVSTLDIASSTGNDATIPAATTLLTGLMAAADKSKLDGIEAGADVTDATNVEAAGAVMVSDYDAHSILYATSDNTPVALTVGEQRIVGRITGGNIVALTPAQIISIIDDADGAGSGLDADLLDGLDTSSSGNRWDVIPTISSGGVMDIGRYIDFHASDGDTGDYMNRIDGGLGAGTIRFGDGSITSILQMNGAAGTNRSIQFLTNGAGRWDVLANTGAESTGNLGSDFAITRRSDAGTGVDSPISISRATGGVTIGGVSSTSAHILRNTNDTQNVQVAQFRGGRATPTANDTVYWSIYGNDSGLTLTEYYRHMVQLADVTDGSEDANLIEWLMVAGTLRQNIVHTSTAFRPATDGLWTLGATSFGVGAVYINTGGFVDFENGDVQILHSTNKLDFTGATSGYQFDNNVILSESSPTLVLIDTDTGAQHTISGNSAAGSLFMNADIGAVGSNPVIAFSIANVSAMQMDSTGFRPLTGVSRTLGNTTQGWAALHGATGFDINIANGDWVAEHSSGILNVTTGDIQIAGSSVVTAAELGTYAPLSGGKTFTDLTAFTVPAGADLDTGIAGQQGGPEVFQNTSGADALLAFHVSGDYAGYFGLDGGLNDLVWGGWSVGSTTKHRVLHTGNLATLKATINAALDLEIGTDVQAFNAGLGQIAGLADPNADRILFWDDSASAYTYLTAGSGLSISGTTITATGASAASAAQQEAGTDNTVMVTPAIQHRHPSAAKAWVSFAVNGSVNASYNIASVTDSGAGNWTVNIGTDFSSANYCGIAFTGRRTAAGLSQSTILADNSPAAGTFDINNVEGTLEQDPVDPAIIWAVFFGDQT